MKGGNDIDEHGLKNDDADLFYRASHLGSDLL